MVKSELEVYARIKPPRFLLVDSADPSKFSMGSIRRGRGWRWK